MDTENKMNSLCIYIFKSNTDTESMKYIEHILDTIKCGGIEGYPIYIKIQIDSKEKRMIKYKKVDIEYIKMFLNAIANSPVNITFDVKIISKNITDEDIEVFNILQNISS